MAHYPHATRHPSHRPWNPHRPVYSWPNGRNHRCRGRARCCHHHHQGRRRTQARCWTDSHRRHRHSSPPAHRDGAPTLRWHPSTERQRRAHGVGVDSGVWTAHLADLSDEHPLRWCRARRHDQLVAGSRTRRTTMEPPRCRRDLGRCAERRERIPCHRGACTAGTRCGSCATERCASAARQSGWRYRHDLPRL